MYRFGIQQHTYDAKSLPAESQPIEALIKQYVLAWQLVQY